LKNGGFFCTVNVPCEDMNHVVFLKTKNKNVEIEKNEKKNKTKTKSKI